MKIINKLNNTTISDSRDQKLRIDKNETCQFKGKCFDKGIMYRAKVQMEGLQEFKMYTGATENSFKMHFYLHRN